MIQRNNKLFWLSITGIFENHFRSIKIVNQANKDVLHLEILINTHSLRLLLLLLLLFGQTQEKRVEPGDTDGAVESTSDALDCSSNSRSGGRGTEGGGLPAEQPFIKLSQEEYGEHHSSIMHCRSADQCTASPFTAERCRQAPASLAWSLKDVIIYRAVVAILKCIISR